MHILTLHLRTSRLVRAMLLLLALLIVLVAGAAGYDSYAEGSVAASYPPPGRFVAVGGSTMHYLCAGSGEPTLVLLAGINGGLLDWGLVQPELARQRRVCAFDRLGQDWSGPALHPRTFGSAADELHSALEVLDIERPVVVGHSLGGALAQIYAARYPVAGVVLVDGLTADVAQQVVARLGSYQRLDPLARLGLLRPLGAAFAHAAYPPGLRAQMIALRSGSTALVRITDEGALAAQSVPAELRAAEARLTMPLLAIGAEASDVPELPPGAFAAAAQALAKRLPDATYVGVADAPHYVQATHPGAVVAAINGWLSSRVH